MVFWLRVGILHRATGPAGNNEDNIFHDIYARAMEYDARVKLDGKQRMYRINLKAAA